MSESANTNVLPGPRRQMWTEPHGGALAADDRLAFARLLANGVHDPVVRLINPDNTSRGEVPLSAVPDNAAYAVRTIDSRTKRSHAVALDFDAKTHPRTVARYEAQLIHALLRRCGIRALVCESGPNSGFHVLVRIAGGGVTPEGRKLLISGLGRLGLLTLDRSPLSGSGMIRPPGSPHRLGGRSQVVGDPEEALADLVAGAGPGLITVFRKMLPGEPRATVDGSAGGVDFLTDFKTRDYASGSEASFALAWHCIQRGMSVSMFIEIAMAPATHPKLAAAILKRGPDAQKWLRDDWRRAERKLASEGSRSRGGTEGAVRRQDVLEAWRREIPGADLKPNHRAVAEVMLGLADLGEGTLASVSVRDLAKRAGLSRGTAHRGLQGLVAAGMVAEVTGRRHGSASNRYNLLHSCRWDVAVTGTVCSSPLGGVSLQTVPPKAQSPLAADLAHDVANDVWAARGVGQTGRLIYGALVEATGASVKDLSAVARVGDQQVRRILKNLESAGLARRADRFTWDAEYADPRLAAAKLGSAGAGERRTHQFEVERRDDHLRLLERRIEAKVADGELVPLGRSRPRQPLNPVDLCAA